MTIPPAIVKECLRDAIQRQLDEVALVSVPEAARLLDVSPDTARRLLVHGVDTGGKGYKVRIADVRRVIEERRIKL